MWLGPRCRRWAAWKHSPRVDVSGREEAGRFYLPVLSSPQHLFTDVVPPLRFCVGHTRASEQLTSCHQFPSLVYVPQSPGRAFLNAGMRAEPSPGEAESSLR